MPDLIALQPDNRNLQYFEISFYRSNHELNETNSLQSMSIKATIRPYLLLIVFCGVHILQVTFEYLTIYNSNKIKSLNH